MKNLRLQFKKLLDSAAVPVYAHTGEWGDLGADLHAAEEVCCSPGEIKSIRTGVALAFPKGYGGIVADRSSLALVGLTTLAGIIDPGYRGEIKVVMANLGAETRTVRIGDRIAQLIIIERIEAHFDEADDLSSSSRQDKGFGSSGR
jgi:dUTP pyrophosphatase